MQTPPAAPAPPPAVQAPATAIAPQAPVATVALPSYQFLRSRGAELSRQLTSANSRRDEYARDLRRGNEASQAGVQARISVLDARIVDLEKAIAENGQQLALIGGRGAEEAIASTQVVSTAFGGLPAGNVTAISIVFTIFVLAPIAMSMARLMWKRGTRIGKVPPANPQADIRLERVEQGVDAIAVEVERISEGQRFVTQLLANNEKLSAIGKPAAEPVAIPVQLNNTVMPGVARRESLG